MSNYEPKFYDSFRPYREDLLKALQSFGMTDFSNHEFWSLGGKEWHEFHYFCKKGVKFGKRAYHNVDREKIDLLLDERTVSHQADFLYDMPALLRCPKCISFDSTNFIIESNRYMIPKLAAIASHAVNLSNIPVLLSANFLTSRGNVQKYATEEAMLDEYSQWIQSLDGNIRNTGKQCHFYNDFSHFSMDGSRSKMVGFHCLVSQG